MLNKTVKDEVSAGLILSGYWVAAGALAVLCALVAFTEGDELGEVNPDSNIGKGILNVRSMSPGHIIRPGIMLSDIRRLKSGTSEIGLGTSWGNVCIYEPERYIVDEEFVRLELRMSWAFCGTLQAGVALPFLWRMGGIADGAIESFHDAFGIGNNAARRRRPRNAVLIGVMREGEDLFVLDEESWGLTDVPVFLSWLLTGGGRYAPAVILSAGGTLPVGDKEQLRGCGSPTYAAGVMLSKRLGSSGLIAAAGGGVTHGGDDTMAGMEMRKSVYTGVAAIECSLTEAFSMLAQLTMSSPTARDFHALSKPVSEINVGLKWDLDDKTGFECSISENLFWSQNSADVGVYFGLSRSL